MKVRRKVADDRRIEVYEPLFMQSENDCCDVELRDAGEEPGSVGFHCPAFVSRLTGRA